MFNSLACPRAVVCSTARECGVVSSPLTTAEALLRLVRYISDIRRRSKASAVPYYRVNCQPAPVCPVIEQVIVRIRITEISG